MEHKDIGYTKSKIIIALSKLALDPRALPARAQEACYELLAASYFRGFEQEFGTINRIMDKVVKGDWSRVDDAEYEEIALAIWRMSERIH